MLSQEITTVNIVVKHYASFLFKWGLDVNILDVDVNMLHVLYNFAFS